MRTSTAQANSLRHQTQKITKKTRQQEAIITVLRSTTSHPTAAWIYDEVRKEIPHISLGTIHRNLRQLAAQGKIGEIRVSGGCKRFDANTDIHYHFLCDQCGTVFDLHEIVAKTPEWLISQGEELKISKHQLELRGLCRECREANDRPARKATARQILKEV